MKYKYKNGGVIKFQNAGSLPKWMQKLNAWANKNVSESDESVGERIFNSTIEKANNASTQEERDKIYKDSAKNNLAVTGQSLMMLPMLGEFATYGLLGGGLRLGTGIVGSKAGEYVLGKGGDWADKQLNTRFLGTTGRIVGGLGGWMGSSSATIPLFRNLAGKGITLRIPDETFNALRSAEFANRFKNLKPTISSVVQTNIEAGKLGWAPSFKQTLWHNSNTPLTKLELTIPAWDVVERGAPLGHTWLTGTETTQGFIGARPYHLKGTVELSKPMIQLGESVGNGKNVVRNQILDFAQKSSSDGINFKSIADNTLKNQDVYAIFKNTEIKPKLSEAERLGIPKGERSNPKALEDPYYWGYQQWNDRYNAAVESGNIQEGRRLYDLHEARNAPNTQVRGDHYHGTNNAEYNIMDSTKNPGRTVGAGEKTSNFFSDIDLANTYLIDAQGMGTWYQGPGRLIRARLNIKNPYIFDYEGAKFNGNGGTAKVYNYLTKTFKDFQNGQLKYFPSESDFIDSWRAQNKYLGKIVPGRDYTYSTSKVKPEIADLMDNIIDRNVYDGAIIKNINEIGSPVTDYVTFTPNQVKLSNIITYDNHGNMIPIVKRHNYHNPDMRYKQGGIIKGRKEPGFK